jgi:hypothetical protein
VTAEQASTVPAGWLQSPTGTAYPPEPWHLRGELLTSAFRVPVRRIPGHVRAETPAGFRPVVTGGRALVWVAFARYVPGGVVAYDELLVAVLGRGRGLRACVLQIWVDSPVSLAGGRELWGIPKHLGRFDRAATTTATRAALAVDGALVADATLRVGRALAPGRPRVPLTTVQRLDGGTVAATSSIEARARALQARWSFAADGPLGYLAGLHPLASVAVTEASIDIGVRVSRT